MDLVVIAGGQRLTLSGHRAEALVVLVLAMVQDDGLEDAEVWTVGVRVTPGQIQPEINRLLKPQKRKNRRLKEAS